MRRMHENTIRLFISSTFKDFLEERSVLNDKVFVKLEKYCQRKGIAFQTVDLRWGISESSSRDQSTVDICL